MRSVFRFGPIYSTDTDRHEFKHDGLRLSYLDSGGEGEARIALHALVMEAATFTYRRSICTLFSRFFPASSRGEGQWRLIRVTSLHRRNKCAPTTGKIGWPPAVRRSQISYPIGGRHPARVAPRELGQAAQLG